MELILLITKILAFTVILIALVTVYIATKKENSTVSITWYQIGQQNKRRGIK